MRFTKMILSDELRMFVDHQKLTVCAALSNYAACAQVSFQNQAPVWKQVGEEIDPSYGELEKKYEEEFEKMKQLDESDVSEVDDSEEETPKAVKKVETYSSESESVPEVSSSEEEKSDSDDLDDVSDSSESK